MDGFIIRLVLAVILWAVGMGISSVFDLGWLWWAVLIIALGIAFLGEYLLNPDGSDSGWW
jgi:hypothetical protein